MISKLISKLLLISILSFYNGVSSFYFPRNNSDTVSDIVQNSTSSLMRLDGFAFCNRLDHSYFKSEALLDGIMLLRLLEHLKMDIPDPLLPLKRRKSKRKRDIFRDKIRHILENIKLLFTKMQWKRKEKPRNMIEAHELKSQLPLIIDEVAKSLLKNRILKYVVFPARFTPKIAKRRHARVSYESAKDFSCFMAADGYNKWVRLAMKDNLLVFVSPDVYFGGNISFAPSSNIEDVEDEWKIASNPRYLKDKTLFQPRELTEVRNIGHSRSNEETAKLAYLLLVHDNFENVVSLIRRLSDANSLVMIHVDSKNPVLKHQLIDFIEGTDSYSENVRVMSLSYNGRWGHSSLVMAYLSGIFEMLDWNTSWEYVINLSGYDYPLANNRKIYNTLKEGGSSSFISYSRDPSMASRLTSYPCMVSSHGDAGAIRPTKGEDYRDDVSVPDTCSVFKKGGFLYRPHLQFPFPDWKLFKHHQWLVLHRSAVSQIRISHTASTFLAFADYTIIPDESFFATLLANLRIRVGHNEEVGQLKVTNKFHHYLNFDGNHPRPITYTDRDNLARAVVSGKLFTRKLNISDEPELIHWINGNLLQI